MEFEHPACGVGNLALNALESNGGSANGRRRGIHENSGYQLSSNPYCTDVAVQRGSNLSKLWPDYNELLWNPNRLIQ